MTGITSVTSAAVIQISLGRNYYLSLCADGTVFWFGNRYVGTSLTDATYAWKQLSTTSNDYGDIITWVRAGNWLQSSSSSEQSTNVAVTASNRLMIWGSNAVCVVIKY
jgi:alpha-tubulin suppressor-like RCC1 family protein